MRQLSLFLGLLALSAVFLAGPAQAANFTVNAGDPYGYYNQFMPSTLQIHAGDSVTWTNVSGGNHDVHADDDSFRCSNGCDDTGGDGSPSTAAWSFTRTFKAAGTINYHCDTHGSMGMVGSITVLAAQPVPGTLRFSNPTYSASEGGGSALITVTRTGGDDGQVSVQYATADGTAKAPGDYVATSGTLTWADHDDANKTFSVHIVNDSLVEPNETVHLSISTPTGGASLGSPSSAVLTILDNDSGGGPLSAPSSLTAQAQSTSEILLNWSDNSSNETGFRIEQQSLGGAFAEVATAPANATSMVIGGLAEATFYNFRVRAAGTAGFSAYSNVAGAATNAVPAPCVDGPNTLCVDGGRFKAEVTWKTSTGNGMGIVVPLASAPASGLFYFFDPTNIEMLVKVLNACVNPFNRYWVFFAATTNVQFTLTVTDTQTGLVKVYFNPQSTAAAPVQDTSAFATCP